jgi:hypothetical protein
MKLSRNGYLNKQEIFLITHGPDRKRRLGQFFYCCVSSLPRERVTEPLPSNDRGIHIQTHRLMGGIYEVHR